MEHLGYLPKILVLLTTAIIIVAIFKRLNLSPVLGYLVAGTAIGEHGLGYVRSEDLHIFGELGVVFLLFAIGLELTIERLMAMRWHVFGFGSAQVLITTILIATACYFSIGLSIEASIIIGGGLALSSTAVVLRVLQSSSGHNTQVGRLALANLLLQDFAVVPLLVLVPLLANPTSNITLVIATAMGKAIVVLIAIFFLGRMLLRPLFNIIAQTKSNELFIAATLLVVLGMAYITEIMGLSMAMGAFIGGLLVAETSYQNRVEDNVNTFKGLLMGLFFMTVGMTINMQTIYEKLPLILTLCSILVLFKAIIIIGLSRVFNFPWGSAIHAGLLLAQGGEFAFILFRLASQDDIGLLSPNTAETLLLVVTITMAITPLLSTIGKKLHDKIDKASQGTITPEQKEIEDLNRHVVIIGFGETGHIIGKLLSAQKINFIAIEADARQVKTMGKEGFPVYHGDAHKVDVLRSLHIEKARAVIITLPNNVYAKKIIKVMNKEYPDVPIVVRTKNLSNVRSLYKIGASSVVPEKHEAGLQLAAVLLTAIGVTAHEIDELKHEFRVANYIHDLKNPPQVRTIES